MSKLTDIIFNGKFHKVTSPFGSRNVINTKGGMTSAFHSGTDYGTNRQNLEQYAVSDGYVFASSKTSEGAYYVWIIYPSIKKAMIHCHLMKPSDLRAGNKVTKGTLIGYTGMSGKATGIHLHLGIRDLRSLPENDINHAMTWSKLQSCPYIDPEAYGANFEEVNIKSYLPARGYIKLGDNSATVGKIASFMYKTFSAYTPKAALGNKYGPNICGAVKEFQRRTGLEVDGYIGPITLNKMIEYGLKL